MKAWLVAVLAFLFGILLASALYANLLLLQPAQTTPTAAAPRAAEPVERSMPIVAVDERGQGHVGALHVRMIPGNANVLIDTNPFLETDIQYSANIAVTVAKLRAEAYVADKDFILSYESDAPVIGGGSAGAATTLAVMAALEGRSLRNDTAITGEIYPDGTIGRVGGVAEKAQAVAEAGYERFLVPEGQAQFTYYERVVEPVQGRGFVFYNERYVPRSVDLTQVAADEWGLEIVEVATIDEAASMVLA